MTAVDDGRTPEVGMGSVLANRYRLDAVVGRGGMSIVYRAWDLSLERDVALKVFHPGHEDAGTPRRRRDEVRLLARFSHPALVTLFDCVEDGSGTVLVMQYVPGRDLGERLESGPIAAHSVAAIGADLADALAYLRDEGIVHRDIKPANILLPAGEDPRPSALLADFGIARLVDSTSVTATGTVIGTVDYLSPEQAMGRTLTPGSDVYSLGLVLIECLTGRRCFSGPAAESVSMRLAGDPEVPRDLGAAWEGLLSRMTAREPEERIGAAEAAATLRAIATSGESATPATAGVASDDAATSYAPTLVYATDETTELMSVPAARAVPAAQPIPAAPAGGAPEHKPATGGSRGRARWPWVIAAAAAIAIASGAGLSLWVQSLPSPAETGVIEYPVVDGDLGIHLEQLQGSVAP